MSQKRFEMGITGLTATIIGISALIWAFLDSIGTPLPIHVRETQSAFIGAYAIGLWMVISGITITWWAFVRKRPTADANN